MTNYMALLCVMRKSAISIRSWFFCLDRRRKDSRRELGYAPLLFYIVSWNFSFRLLRPWIFDDGGAESRLVDASFPYLYSAASNNLLDFPCFIKWWGAALYRKRVGERESFRQRDGRHCFFPFLWLFFSSSAAALLLPLYIYSRAPRAALYHYEQFNLPSASPLPPLLPTPSN